MNMMGQEESMLERTLHEEQAKNIVVDISRYDIDTLDMVELEQKRIMNNAVQNNVN